MSEFQVQPGRTQPLTYFWCGVVAGAERYNIFSQPIIRG